MNIDLTAALLAAVFAVSGTQAFAEPRSTTRLRVDAVDGSGIRLSEYGGIGATLSASTTTVNGWAAIDVWLGVPGDLERSCAQGTLEMKVRFTPIAQDKHSGLPVQLTRQLLPMLAVAMANAEGNSVHVPFQLDRTGRASAEDKIMVDGQICGRELPGDAIIECSLTWFKDATLHCRR